MFWKLIVLALLVWAVAFYFSITFGGLIHGIPVAVVIAIIVRRMTRNPDSEFGRWRPASERGRR